MRLLRLGLFYLAFLWAPQPVRAQNPTDQWIVVLQRVNGVITPIETFLVPTQPAPPARATTAAWITLTVSPTDPLVWCAAPITGATFVPSMLHEFHTQGQPFGETGSTAVVAFDAFVDIQPGPNVAPGGINLTSIPPTWDPTVCSGKQPGVVFPANGLQPGETRVSVQARVTF